MATSSPEQLCRRFTLPEIQSATGDFSSAHLIGEGGFGKVYKGSIDNGSAIVAVKRQERNSEQGRPEFTTEIETLSKLRHRNIVSLIGYCSEQGEMILVYEYIANQTLAYHLHKPSRNGHSSLTWTELLNICIAAGRGLDYLHTGGSHSSIVHRDIKSTNILLDENLVAKISDFGTAKHLSADSSESHFTANIKGTSGYVDPCFAATGNFSMKSDTYAFGVVLLEVVSERRAYDMNRPERERTLSDWALEKIRRGKAHEIVASRLSGEIGKDCLKEFLEIAKSCLQDKPENRPTIAEVRVRLGYALSLHQKKRRPTRRFWQFSSSPKRVILSGLLQDQVGVNMLPQAIQEDALEHEQAVDIPRVATPVIPVDANISVPAISQAELQDIVDDFSSKCLIANGSSGGSLFRGVLKTGKEAAIKRLNKKLPDKEFLEQVSIISRLQHEHVVQLLGYCVNGDLQVLAYEFTSRGSLHDILHGRPGTSRTTGVAMEPGAALSWAQRINIAVGAAKGLHHIHENEMIHHSIKSSNVLLFEDGNAKISDACQTTEYPCKAARADESYPFPLPSGCCYHPPECELINQTQKGDVYSFGVVLLELLTGQKPFDPRRPLGQQFLAIWAAPMLNEDNIQMIVDARLTRNYPLTAVMKMVEVTALCLDKESDSRPDMSTVLRYLQKALWETQTCVQKRQQLSQRVKS